MRWIDIATEKKGAGASKTTVSVLREKKNALQKAHVMIDVSTLSENGLPRGMPLEPLMFAWPGQKKSPTDIVHLHVAQLMIDRTFNNICLFWPSTD